MGNFFHSKTQQQNKKMKYEKQKCSSSFTHLYPTTNTFKVPLPLNC